MKILMRRLIRSRLIWISTVCRRMFEFTWCPKLPDFTLLPLEESDLSHWLPLLLTKTRVKSGIFGQTAKFGQPPCLFHSSFIGIKNRISKQTVKILIRRLILSYLDFHCLQKMYVRIYLMSELNRLSPTDFGIQLTRRTGRIYKLWLFSI